MSQNVSGAEETCIPSENVYYLFQYYAFAANSPEKKDYNLIVSEGIKCYWHGSYINSYNIFFIQAIVICIHIQIALVLMSSISHKILRSSRQ